MAKLKQCTVIGAGIGGMAAAALLAHKGYSVTVYEQAPTYGGKARAVTVGKSTFGLGPSLCTDVDSIDAIFKTCGKNPRTYWNYTKLPELGRYFWPESTTPYIMPSGLPYVERSLVREFNENPRRVRKYMDSLTYMYKKVTPQYIDKPFDLVHQIKPSLFKQAYKAAPYSLQTLHRRNTHYFKSSHVRQLFDRYATYSGSNPYTAPALTGLAAGPEIIHGAHYAQGGIKSISDAMYTLCQELGVTFVFNAKVTSLEEQSGAITALRYGSKRQIVENLVYNGDSARLHELLGNGAAKQKILSKERSMSGALFYWQVKGNFKKLGLHNIIFSSDYVQEFEQLYRRREVPSDPTIYLTISSKIDKTHAPKGSENWRVMINAPAHLPESSMMLARDTIVEKLESFMGGYLTIEAEEIIGPHQLDSLTGAWGGAIYGQSGNSLPLIINRPPNRVAGYANLYLVGGTAHPGGGIPLVVRSARIVARQLS